MNEKEVKLRSWTRFVTRDFVIEPSLLGNHHAFTFENHNIEIILPGSDMVNRGKGYDEVISVTERRTVDNEPIQYNVHGVEVTVTLPVIIEVPSEVLNRNPKAFELFSDKEQKNLDAITFRHKRIAEKAFNYWIRVVRWKSDISSLGRHEERDNNSLSGTDLYDIVTEKKIWMSQSAAYARHIKRVMHDEWNEIQNTLEQELYPPIYHELKHGASAHGIVAKGITHDLAALMKRKEMRYSPLKQHGS